MRDDKGEFLIPTTLPHAAAKAALKQALATPRLFAISPGATVAIDVNSLPDATERPKARAALESKLKASGFKVAESAPVTLKASLSSEPVQRIFRMAGPKLEDKSVNVTRYVSQAEFLVNGQQAWSAVSVVGDLLLVKPKSGESLEAAARRETRPDYGFFSTVQIPQFVLPPGMKTLGSTAASASAF